MFSKLLLGTICFYLFEQLPLSASSLRMVPCLLQEKVDDSTFVSAKLRPIDDKRFIRKALDYTINVDLSIWPLRNLSLGKSSPSEEKMYISVLGGGLSAGVRNGGLYRFSQLTAYPALVAQQLGISNFKTPVFAESEANGTGFLQLIDDGTPYPTWQEVKNKTAPLNASNIPELPVFNGTVVHNLAVPHGDLVLANSIFGENSAGVYPNGKTWTIGQVFANRIVPMNNSKKKESLFDNMARQPINLYILEDGFDELIESVKQNTHLRSYGFDKINLSASDMVRVAVKRLKQDLKVNRGVVFTLPMITDLAFMNWYIMENFKKKVPSFSISYTADGQNKTLNHSSAFLFMPTFKVDSLFRNVKEGSHTDIALTDADIMDSQEIHMTTTMLKTFNEMTRSWARSNEIALVDLEKIYQAINANNYVTKDGCIIRGGQKGNFFSADGIYPTAVGQAVIANEVITSINKTYNLNFPLIDVSAYSAFSKQQ